MKKVITLGVNGKEEIVEVEPYTSLNDALRKYLGLKGTKRGCDYGGCGACTVIVDGRAVYSCMMPVMKVVGSDIITIEGLTKQDGLHPLQEAFIRHGAVQCGYCTPGIIMSAHALLLANPRPTETDVEEAISGNMCRCTGYINIKKAILSCAESIGKRSVL